ncbi:transmembrane protein 131-like isoform X3 [Argiope bruennichi]|uniref:transmembrane protein 131-like isoform X3 n=1 Tax=Argiope bruennichi TaxID=94029 RepID=UPI0024942A50|nr:transmembrane protein 131-like isoform X3 [Argiope bruennichi]
MARMCVSCKLQSGKMKSQKVLRILLLYNILETVYRVVQAGDGRTHAFVHVDGDLRYLVDGVSMEMKEFYREEDTSAISFTDLNEENLNAYASPIAFHPPMLNFHSHPVGMPHMEHVIVQNLSPDTSIHMLSISGNTLHTHCSFFQEKVIPPGGNTSFDVVLLAREEGPVEDTLFIHTSLGSFKFQVSAVGIPNPYRLRPFVGVRMPLNSSYTPIIFMHNPHSTTIQLTEMYSSGGDLHLELPDGESEAPKSLWEIPPYETKPVIKANFIARVEKNHTAFIRIRTNCTREDYLLLPVEVDVSSAPGIYSPTEILDFGVLRSDDQPKVLTLSLLNSGPKHVHLVNVIATPVNEAVDVKFMPLKIPPDTVFSTQVATITFTPSRALHPKQCCGKIVIKSKNNQYKLQIPYQVQLIRGFLDYNKNCTRFYVGQQNSSHIKEFNVTNNFSVVIIVYSISLPDEAKEHFTVKMAESIILKPGKSATVAFLTFKPTVPDLQLTSYLRLHTNISHFDIPLLCFTGRLKVFLPHAVNESFIDFGTLGMGDKRTVVFAVINENPVDVNLKFWGSNSSKTYVELVGVDKGNASTLAWRQNFSAMARSLILKPQHYAIFRIGITAPNHEGIFHGQAFVETQYEKINVPFSLRTAKGALKVDEIFFENSFPGKISTQSLYVHSTFSHSMTVTGISTVPEDSRFTFDPLKHGTPVLHPNSKNMVGKIHFDHRKYCKQKCYSGLPTTTSMGHQWLLGMALPPDVGEMDGELFRTLSKRWHSLIDLEEKTTNITLRIDTTEVRGYLLKAHASLHWPRMFSRYKLKFPITQIGNHTVKDFTLENPSSLPVLVQVVPLSLYPNPANIISILKERYGDDFGGNNIIKDSEVFSLEDLEDNNPNPDNHIPAYRKSLEEFFGIQTHKKSIAMLLTPGMRVRIQVGFTPKDDSLKSSLILIRNNLTVMDALLVLGQGGYGQIKFGNIPPGSDSMLMFELTERLLKDCDSTKIPKYASPNFTVRRAFTARNTGALPMYVKGFDINGKPCQGYGFRILNCQEFELKPNSSKKIDIAYTPDFSLTHIERTLNIHTSQGPEGQILQYKIVATVPRHMLSFCSGALPRPPWEFYVYCTCIIFSIFGILSMMCLAYMDSKRILHSTFFPFITLGIHTEKIDKENIFDLNALCTISLENSFIKHNCPQTELGRKKENCVENATISENGLNALKNPEISTPKKKESLHSREFDDIVSDVSKHSRKRTSKRQIHENYYLEPSLIDIKKTQARNSWTRFLKPPFSFHSSNVNKPSVATQTTPISTEEDDSKSFKELDRIDNQSINTFENIENSTPKFRNKNDHKYNEVNNCFKKTNDMLLEEETSSTTTETSSTTTETSSTTTETSSTTTETSTTESDISERDNRLPDVCVTSKSQKIRYKNKYRDVGTGCNSRMVTKSVNTVDGKGFELSSKSKSHKKVKVDPSKAFGGDILRPSTLELPYKPKPTAGDEKDDCLEMYSEEDLAAVVNGKGNGVFQIAEDELIDSADQNQNFTLRQGIHSCLWIKTSELKSPLSLESPFSKFPSYSAAVTKEALINNGENDVSIYGINRISSESIKSISSSKSKRTPNCHPFVKRSSKHSFGQNSWNFENGELFGSSDVESNLLGSKLRHWMLQSSPNCCTSFSDSAGVYKNENRSFCNSHCKFAGNCSISSNNISTWCGNSQVSCLEQSLQAERLRLEACKNQLNVYNDWPGFDLTPVRESFWDSNYSPSGGSWTEKPEETEMSNVSPNSIWSNPLTSVWESEASTWTSNTCDNGNCVDEASMNENLLIDSEKTASENKESAVGEFDPFHTPSALWMSQLSEMKENFTGSSESSTWSFSLFSNPSQVLFPENSQDSSETVGKVETKTSENSA